MKRCNSALLSALLFAITTNVSQGQTPALDSLQAARVQDSARVGSLVYRAATTLTYPKRNPNEPGDIKGDLITVLTITNRGSKREKTTLARCALQTSGTFNPQFRPMPGVVFPRADSCGSKDQDMSLEPAESRNVTVVSRDWKHGQYRILGPIYFTASVQLSDTVLRLRAGRTIFASDLSSLEYHATTSVEGVAPDSLVIRVTIANTGDLPVAVQLGGCSVKLRAFRSTDKTGKPVWRSDDSGPFHRNFHYSCVTPGYYRQIAPGYSNGSPPVDFRFPAYEVLGDTLPGGRYYFTAELEYKDQRFPFDAGSAVIPSMQKPLPASRTFSGIQLTTSARRISHKNGAPDSLELKFTAKNTSKSTSRLRPGKSIGCLNIFGYKRAERRNSYYRRSEENDWSIRGCAMRISDFELAQNESRVFLDRVVAPVMPMHYVIRFQFFDEVQPGREPSLFGDLAVDEDGYGSQASDTLLIENPRMMERLANMVPGFGGVFVDSDVFNVYMMDLSRAAFFESEISQQLSPDPRTRRPIRFVQARYSYLELAHFANMLLPHLGRGYSLFGVDDRKNRYRVEYVNEQARQNLEAAIRKLGLPRDAFVIEPGEYFHVL